MVLDAYVPKTAAGRPPSTGGPPLGTTFSNDPDDRDDMLTHLRDNVQRLVSQAEHSPKQSVSTFLRLLDQRRQWVKNELSVEDMLGAAPEPPLGIPDNPYDLSTLAIEPPDQRRRAYETMLGLIDRTMAELWERMLGTEEPSE